MVTCSNSRATTTRLHKLQLLARSRTGSPNKQDTEYHTMGKATTTSPDIWDVRATKTPIRDLHIMTHNAKHTPVRGSVYSHTHQVSSSSSSSSSPRVNRIERYRQANTRSCPPSRYQTASPFDRLPDDVITKILSFLNANELVKFSRISRRFYFLVWEPELWTSITLVNSSANSLKPIDADLALKTIIRLLSRNSNKHNNLESLTLSGCQRLTDRGLAIVARRCPNLKRLEIQQCSNITNGGLMDLLTKCPLVDHLDVTGKNKWVKFSVLWLSNYKVPFMG